MKILDFLQKAEELVNEEINKKEILETPLEKGSWQKKHPFNPKKEQMESHIARDSWVGGMRRESRDKIQRTEGNARRRALRNLMKQTKVKKHPETGELMFLMHRGMGLSEYDPHHKEGMAKYPENTRTSWTPKYGVAHEFGSGTYAPDSPNAHFNEKKRTVSAWIPESQLHSSIPQHNLFGKKMPRDEQEWVVHHAAPFKHAPKEEFLDLRPDPVSKEPETYRKLQERKRNKLAASEDINNDLKKKMPEFKDQWEDEDDFINYHKTGHIREDAYKNLTFNEPYDAKEKHPRLRGTVKTKNGDILELRSSNEPLKYVKTTDDNEIARDSEGTVLYISPEEMAERNLPTHDTTINVYHGDRHVGYASDEFGSDGVFLHPEYHGKGIGTQLLHHFRQQFPSRRRIGQMTPSGEKMSRAYYRKYIKPIKKSESDLKKGSFQRRYRFNPKKTDQDMKAVNEWSSGSDDNFDTPTEEKYNIKSMEPNARKRAIRKLASQTEVRRDPETGELMFLMHRGMSGDEHDSKHGLGVANYLPEEKTSWTPKYDIAHHFGNEYNYDGKVASAWVPESALHASLNQYNIEGRNPTLRDEHEWIITHPRDFYHANMDAVKQMQQQRKDKVRTYPGEIKLKQDYKRGIKYNKEDLAASEKLNNNLQKSRKDYMQMLSGPEGLAPEHKEVVDWTVKNVPNSNWGTWFIKNYRKNPEILREKDTIQHYASMAQQVPEIGNYRFDTTHDFRTGIKALKAAEDKYLQTKKDGWVGPTRKTKKIMDLGDRWGWYDLGVHECAEEGKAMGHCGNVGSDRSSDRILSLRREHNVGGKVFHEPHLTFIKEKGGFLGQMKGRGNTKPSKGYHPHIKKLLLDPKSEINYIAGGGYLPEKNFSLRDLPKEEYDEVINKAPHFKPWRSNNIQELDTYIAKLSDSSRSKEIIPKIQLKKDLLTTHKDNWYKAALDIAISSDNTDAFGLLPKTPKLMSYVLKNAPKAVRAAAIKHPNATPEHITQALRDEHDYVREVAIKHPNATPEHITQALQDEHDYVRAAAIEHPNATPEHITQALRDRNNLVGRQAIRHPNATPEHITQALQDGDYLVRGAAIRHPNATPEHITQALQDGDYLVREVAIRHPNATPEHITQALQDKYYSVRAVAIEHPNATPEHITQALQDEHDYVRAAAIEHPNATPEHITQALQDGSSYVRAAAKDRLKEMKKSEINISLQKKSWQKINSNLASKKFSALKKTKPKSIIQDVKSFIPDMEILPKLKKPFKSKNQRRFAHTNPEKFGGKEGIKEWEEKTPKDIPEKKKIKKKLSNKFKAIAKKK